MRAAARGQINLPERACRSSREGGRSSVRAQMWWEEYLIISLSFGKVLTQTTFSERYFVCGFLVMLKNYHLCYIFKCQGDAPVED